MIYILCHGNLNKLNVCGFYNITYERKLFNACVMIYEIYILTENDVK